MNKPKGGRGKKASYETKVVRLPKIAAAYAHKIGDNARELIEAGDDDLKLCYCSIERTEAIKLAEDILSKKLNSRQSLQKLLQVLYDPEIRLQTEKKKPVTGKAGANL